MNSAYLRQEETSSPGLGGNAVACDLDLLGIELWLELAYSISAKPSWWRLEAHWVRWAISRATRSEGSRIETSSPMMPTTTSSSTRLKPRRLEWANMDGSA